MDLMKMAKKKMAGKAWEMIKKRRNSEKRLETLQIKKQIKKKRRIRRIKVASVIATCFLCRHLIKRGLKKPNRKIKELVYHDAVLTHEADSKEMIHITQ